MSNVIAVAIVTLALMWLPAGGWAEMGGAAPALKTAPGSKADAHNGEGMDHYKQGHFDVALKHIQEAVKADPASAEAHYNLALALDKSGDHKGATEHFKKALELGKANPEIQNSGILKAHLKMK
jgi:Flp pilus assembly protein TadD